MKKRVCLFVFLMLILIPVVFASIDINIKTLPEHKVEVFVRNVGKFVNLDSSYKNTGDGNVVINIELTKSQVDLLVTLKKNGTKIL